MKPEEINESISGLQFGSPGLRKPKPSQVEKLANDHWDYSRGLIAMFGQEGVDLSALEFLYKAAFKHGWKHAKEDGV